MQHVSRIASTPARSSRLPVLGSTWTNSPRSAARPECDAHSAKERMPAIVDHDILARYGQNDSPSVERESWLFAGFPNAAPSGLTRPRSIATAKLNDGRPVTVVVHNDAHRRRLQSHLPELLP